MRYLSVFLLSLFMIACSQNPDQVENNTSSATQVEMVTNLGTIVLELSDSTPLHRDNFITIVEEGVLDSVLFHRVINEFMIQAGDPDSQYAASGDTLGNGGLDYKVPAEFHPALFHKRGALGAARDGNPQRASSSTQFYIVQRGPRADSLIDKDEKRINGWLAEHYVKTDSNFQFLTDSINVAIANQDRALYMWANDSIAATAKMLDFERYEIPESHREVYRTKGGTPHLDQNYTVFGEVISGMSVVDSIAAIETGPLDRPSVDVRILSIRILE